MTEQRLRKTAYLCGESGILRSRVIYSIMAGVSLCDEHCGDVITENRVKIRFYYFLGRKISEKSHRNAGCETRP